MSGLETLRVAVHEYGEACSTSGWEASRGLVSARLHAKEHRDECTLAVEGEMDRLELRLEELEQYRHRTAALSAALYELTYQAFPDSVDMAAKILKLVED